MSPKPRYGSNSSKNSGTRRPSARPCPTFLWIEKMKRVIAIGLSVLLPGVGLAQNKAPDALNNQAMLAPIAGYRAQRDQQPALATVISSSQARQIFEAQVGNMQLTDIPLVSISSYLLWAYVGPP